MTMAKAQMRKHIASILQSLSTEAIAIQNGAVVQKVLTHPRYQQSTRVSIYLNTPKEISTEPILEDLFRNGKTVFIPRFESKRSVMEMVRLASMDDYRSLPSTTWNIKQPKLDEEREDALNTGGLDLIIVPGVAFTKDGKRLGHGKGYYDSFFAQHKQSCGYYPFSIALALREQMVDDLMVTERDHVVDEILYQNL